MHPSFGDGASLARSSRESPMFFFEVCETTFFMAMASLKEMLFRLGSLHFGERDGR